MAWVLLVTAGLLEIGFAIAMKQSAVLRISGIALIVVGAVVLQLADSR